MAPPVAWLAIAIAVKSELLALVKVEPVATVKPELAVSRPLTVVAPFKLMPPLPPLMLSAAVLEADPMLSVPVVRAEPIAMLPAVWVLPMVMVLAPLPPTVMAVAVAVLDKFRVDAFWAMSTVPAPVVSRSKIPVPLASTVKLVLVPPEVTLTAPVPV
jgi:hypothetical protein